MIENRGETTIICEGQGPNAEQILRKGGRKSDISQTKGKSDYAAQYLCGIEKDNGMKVKATDYRR